VADQRRERSTTISKATDNLSKAGWSWGCVSAINSKGRTIWIADAHRGDGKRFVVRADELLTAFLELEAAIRGFLISDVKYLLYRGALPESLAEIKQISS